MRSFSADMLALAARRSPELLRQERATGSAAIGVVTSDARPSDVSRAIEAGADEVLVTRACPTTSWPRPLAVAAAPPHERAGESVRRIRLAEQLKDRVRWEERRTRPRDAVAGEPPRAHLVSMIVGTYHEMPGLQLHVGDAARLFGLRAVTCQIVLDALVEDGELRRTDEGRYVRA